MFDRKIWHNNSMRKTFQTFLLILLALICGLLALLFRHEPEEGERPDIRTHDVIWFSYQYTGSQEYQMIIAEDGGETERLMVRRWYGSGP